MKSYAQRRSRLQEKRAARDVGGATQAGSGSSSFAKGDFRKIGNIRGECKFTRSDTYILKKEDLEKIQLEALKGGLEDWVMQVEFVRTAGQSQKFAVLDWTMFVEMWGANYPSKNGDPFLTQTSICQVGKSFRFNPASTLGTVLKTVGCTHLTQVVFVEKIGDEVAQPKKAYVIAPWETYLAVRTTFMERSE